MIYGVEGNVHVGKTTFINKIVKKMNLNILKEISFREDCNDFERQLYYINEEKKRIGNLNNNLILDRTIISIFLYTLYSNRFTKEKVEKISCMIADSVKKEEFIIPNKIFFIIYPYELICNNHNILAEDKNTQSILIDYNYYLNYTLFFSKYIDYKNLTLNVSEHRQFLEFSPEILFKNILNYKNEKNSILLLDGSPAIGKSSIGKFQNTLNYIEECHYKKYTLENCKNQIDSIVYRINLLQNNNVLIDTSFLMGITHLFYNEKTTKEFKIKAINLISQQVPLCLYVTKIVYLIADKEELYRRKNDDKKKVRKDFSKNLSYLESEKNFYIRLDKKLKDKSNIHILTSIENIENMSKIVLEILNKPLLLIDLFYAILQCIEDGEI